MSIPRETHKEFVITVENDAVDLGIAPMILDSVMVVGKAPKQNPLTMLFKDYDPRSKILTIQTAEGTIFTINNTDGPDEP